MGSIVVEYKCMESIATIGYNVRRNISIQLYGVVPAAWSLEVSEKHTRFVREIVETIAFTLLIFSVIHFAVQGFRTNGESMEPNFHNNEYVLVNKAAYLLQQPQRGDVIVFRYPLDPNEDFIKRIIGLPGNTVQTTPDSVRVDGVVLNEPFISIPSNIANETWKLAPNQFFVMGDNRDNSLDSRFWGPLDKSYIVGKVVLSYWPLNEVSLINTFPTVFAAIHSNH